MCMICTSKPPRAQCVSHHRYHKQQYSYVRSVVTGFRTLPEKISKKIRILPGKNPKIEIIRAFSMSRLKHPSRITRNSLFFVLHFQFRVLRGDENIMAAPGRKGSKDGSDSNIPVAHLVVQVRRMGSWVRVHS